MTVGKRIKRLRGKRSLTIAALSELSGVNGEQISRIERGLDKPQAGTLERLATALGVDVAVLDYETVIPVHPIRPVDPQRTTAPHNTAQPALAVADAPWQEYAPDGPPVPPITGRGGPMEDRRWLSLGALGTLLTREEYIDLERKTIDEARRVLDARRATPQPP